MSDERRAQQARPHEEVIAEVMDPCRSKSEHEWYAAREIERLRDEVERLNQIVMAVGRKYPGEERWETALRYVREMESFCTTAQAQANRPRPVEAPDE